MDLHNNKVGWLHAKASENNRKSDYRLCTAMRRAVVHGRKGATRATERQLYWLRSRDNSTARNYVHVLRPNRCPTD